MHYLTMTKNFFEFHGAQGGRDGKRMSGATQVWRILRKIGHGDQRDELETLAARQILMLRALQVGQY